MNWDQIKAWLVRGWSKVWNGWRLRGHHRHHRRIRQAQKVRQIITSIMQDGKPYGEARSLTYLRKIDAYVFEELVLEVLESRYRVERSKQYSGDGGVDGKFKQDGRWVWIQCKRYEHYIRLDHVKAFNALLVKNKIHKGLFVHTGKTGSGARKEWEGGRVDCLSGSRLVRWIAGLDRDPVALKPLSKVEGRPESSERKASRRSHRSSP